jgi:hypothetical protein
MDFETAVNLSRDVEQAYDGLLVSGFHRTSRERLDSWAIDVVEADSGRLVTLDEKDDWERVLEVNIPDLVRST